MDCLAATYNQEGHGYFVWEEGGEVVGGCGFGAFGPTEERTCELRKLYLLPAARGTGAGTQLVEYTLQQARAAGFQNCYLETVAQMKEAIGLYEKLGFEERDGPLFGGGHHSCDRWYHRSLLTLLLFVMVSLGACAGPAIPESTEAVRAPKLRVELLTMQLEAEELREEFIERGPASLRLSDIYEQRALFRQHTDRMKEIVAAYGWPGRTLVGTDGAAAAAELLIHADHDLQFQREALELMAAGLKLRETQGADYAELYDRIRVAEGLPQLYGTQAHIGNGQLEFFPIEDPAQVDQRRASMGMDSLAEFRRSLEQAYLIRSPGSS